MRRIVLALAFTLTLLAAPAAPAAPTDSDPDPTVTVVRVDRGQVEGIWVTLGDIVFANYYNRALDEHAECAWDRRTLRVLYSRNLEAAHIGD